MVIIYIEIEYFHEHMSESMSIVTSPTLEGPACIQETVQVTYVDLVLDQSLPINVQNDRPSRYLQMRDQTLPINVQDDPPPRYLQMRDQSDSGQE